MNRAIWIVVAIGTVIDVVTGKYAMVFTFRDGLIIHAKFYAQRSEALQAVGLSE